MKLALRIAAVPERLEDGLRLAHQLTGDQRSDPDHLVPVVGVGNHVGVLPEGVEHGKAVGREGADPA